MLKWSDKMDILALVLIQMEKLLFFLTLGMILAIGFFVDILDQVEEVISYC